MNNEEHLYSSNKFIEKCANVISNNSSVVLSEFKCKTQSKLIKNNELDMTKNDFIVKN